MDPEFIRSSKILRGCYENILLRKMPFSEKRLSTVEQRAFYVLKLFQKVNRIGIIVTMP